MPGRLKYPPDSHVDFEETLRLIVHLRDSWRAHAREAGDRAEARGEAADASEYAERTRAAAIARAMEDARNAVVRAAK
jgi:hypothetical protein